MDVENFKLKTKLKVKKLKNGNYYCETMVNGKRHYVSEPSLELLDYKLRALEKERNKMLNNGKGQIRLPLERLWRLFVSTHEAKWKRSTFDNKKRIFEYFKPLWKKDVSKITNMDIEKCLKDKARKFKKKKLSEGARYHVVILLTQLKYTLEIEGIKKSFGVNVKKMRHNLNYSFRKNRYKTKQFHTREEVNRLTKALSKPIYKKFGRRHNIRRLVFPTQSALFHLYRLHVSTGMRVGELMAAKVYDYDKTRGIFRITSSLSGAGNGFVYEDSGFTKNYEDRTVNLNRAARESVDWLIKHAQNEYLSSSMRATRKALKYKFGCPVQYSKAMKDFQRHAGVPILSSHKFGRKTFATLTWLSGIERGRNPRDLLFSIMKALGHSQETVTWRYIRELEDNIEEEVEGIFESDLKAPSTPFPKVKKKKKKGAA